MRFVSIVMLLLALTAGAKERLGLIEAGVKLGESHVVTSVVSRADAVYVRMRSADGSIVTYGLSRPGAEAGLLDIAGARIFYVGEHASTDAIRRGAGLLANALRESGLNGEKLTVALTEKMAAAEQRGDPRRIDPDVAASLLERLRGKWRVTVSRADAAPIVKGTVTRSPFLGTSVLREQSDIAAALSAFSLIGYDRVNRVFWILEIDPSTGAVTNAQGEWNDDEQTMEFRLPVDPEGNVQSVALRMVGPDRHIIEQSVMRKGQPLRLVKSATFER